MDYDTFLDLMEHLLQFHERKRKIKLISVNLNDYERILMTSPLQYALEDSVCKQQVSQNAYFFGIEIERDDNMSEGQISIQFETPNKR